MSALSTTAPAPSPNSTQVPRSVQSTMRVSVSAPTTSARLRGAGPDELVGDRQRVDEARAGGIDVERRAAVGAEAVLQQAGGGREDQVRRGGAEHDQVELGRLRRRRLPARATRGVVGQVAGGLAFGGDVALADAGARGDPLVAGVDELREVVVGQHLFRQVAAGTGDAGEHLLGHAACRDVRPCGLPLMDDPVPVRAGGSASMSRARLRMEAARWRGRDRGINLLRRPWLFGRDDLLAAVVAVGRHVVAHVRLTAWSDRSTAAWRSARHARGACPAGRGNAGLLHSHGIAPASIRDSWSRCVFA